MTQKQYRSCNTAEEPTDTNTNIDAVVHESKHEKNKANRATTYEEQKLTELKTKDKHKEQQCSYM